MLSEIVKLFRIAGLRGIWKIVKFPFYGGSALASAKGVELRGFLTREFFGAICLWKSMLIQFQAWF